MASYKGVPLTRIRIGAVEWSEQAAEHVRSRRVRGGGRDIEPEWATEAVFDSKRLIAIAQADSPNAALVIVGISDSFGGLLKVWIWSDDPAGSDEWNGGSACAANNTERRRYSER